MTADDDLKQLVKERRYDDVVAARGYLEAGSGALLRLNHVRNRLDNQRGVRIGGSRDQQSARHGVASWHRCGNARASR